MKKFLLPLIVMAFACCGSANAAIQVTATNIDQPANDTLLYAMPVNPEISQEIWTSYESPNGVMRFMKFQPEYLVTALDFTRGDVTKGTATLPAYAKVIGLALDGYDIASVPTRHGIFHEVTVWCRNIPGDQMEMEHSWDLWDGYRKFPPQGQLCTDTVTYRGYDVRPGDNHPGKICEFDLTATAADPKPIVDVPFGNPDDPHMPFCYEGENIHLTLWMCNWFDVHMQYAYMAYDNAEAENASLMRTGNYCFDYETQYDVEPVFGLPLPYELPAHRLPAFRTPYFTNDIRVTCEGYETIYELQDQDGNVITPSEDGNYYSLDHTKTYNLVVSGKVRATFGFDDIYKDINLDIVNFTAVEEINTNKTVESVNYYNMAGQMNAEPVNGVNIVVTTYTDGTRSTAKVIK